MKKASNIVLKILGISLIAVPPYGRGPVSENCPCTLGKLDQTREWLVTIPAITLLTDGKVTFAWEEEAPNLDTILLNMTKNAKSRKESCFFASTTHLTDSLLEEEGGRAYAYVERCA